MRTDIPLKRLAELRGADLLPLLGVPATTLRRVDSLELSASAERLDTLLTLVSPQGQEYVLVVEWQAYRDLAVLWRLASYCARIGQRAPAVPVLGCVVYLNPTADVGESLVQVIDGIVIQAWPMRTVRLWEHDAAAAVQGGLLGLAVLSPLMANASEALVEQAASIVLQQAPPAQQADLLVILGVFGEPLVPAARFVRLVGKERLMTSDLVSYLMEEEVAERELRYVTDLQHTLEAAIAARFPSAPLTLAQAIHQIILPQELHRLIITVAGAADLSLIEQALAQALAGADSSSV